MKKTTTYIAQTVRFDSVAEVLAKLNEPRTGGSGNSSTSHDPSESWDKGVGMDGATDILRRGWADGMPVVSELLAAISVRPAKGQVIDWVQDYTGPVFDMGEYASGNPECCWDVEYKHGEGSRYLDLYFNVSLAGTIPAGVPMARASAVLALVDVLETNGIRCRVNALMANHTQLAPKECYATIIKLKDYDEPLHFQDVAFTMGHPAMRRRIGFALDERAQAGGYAVQNSGSWSYGLSYDPTPEALGLGSDAVIMPRIEHEDRCMDAETHLFTLYMALPEDVRDLIDMREGAR